MNDIAQDEIAGYVAQVRTALGGVPESTREELLDDLPEHLAEVLAEGNGSLVERLGTPSAYAAELLAAAGLGGAAAVRRDQLTELQEWAAEARVRGGRWLSEADVRVGPVIGYTKASEFLVLLRPAWWVLRGYLLAMVLAHLLAGGSGQVGLLPRIGGSLVAAVFLLAAGIVASIWLGRRGTPPGRWPRYAFRWGTALLIVLSVVGFAGADMDTRNPSYVDATYSGSSGYDNVRDVFVYDSQGRLVEDAQLYDQSGAPIQMGSQYCTDERTGESWTSWHRGFPRCPEGNPFQSPSATPGPGGEEALPSPVAPSGAPGPSDAPGPSGAPGVTPSGPPASSPAGRAPSPIPSVSPSR
ncbi:HAAS signaling domain-containing protein [Actinoplanes sp. HUAS TT8]|uniref:HAAS signaling domain-containing protein n=1 Tax=Actinoplanes sp. HUAS TT8 TaxID=3447453 RepID=UPI003F51CDD7